MFWSAHTHSKYSVIDALPSVEKIVQRAHELGYPALGLTDHGNMGGAAALYTECKKVGIKPLPGIEAYVQIQRGNKNRKNMHLGMLATSEVGYRNLVALNNTAHNNFYFKPILDLRDLAVAASQGRLEGIAALSGCHFGLLPRTLRDNNVNVARNIMTSLDQWFGSGLFIELQHHNVPDQDDAGHVAALHNLAASLSIPVIITQDSHYCYEEEREQHETMKRLTTWSDDPDDALFPGDGYHMVTVDWLKTRYTESQLRDGLEGLAYLESIADVVIPELNAYTLKVPDTGGNPDTRLRQEVEEGLNTKMLLGKVTASKQAAYKTRIKEELDVVIGAGFSGYLLLTKTVCDFMREKDILFSVRGSASGSLLCWLLGITTLDSLAWNLPFDRFLSRDRTKPPDIDLDIEHRRRDEVIEWISSRYHTVRIGTWGTMKLAFDEDEGEDRGALIVKWQSMNGKAGGDNKAKPEGRELQKLQELAAHKPYGNFGVHAAGLMITPDEATAGCVPLMYAASSKTMVTAFDMDSIERLGLVKLDLLNGKTMTALKLALDATGVNINDIPFNDAATYRLICTKEPTALFQLEGRSFARGIRQMQPRKLTDLIAAMALFRPAAMKSGATERYINRRKNKEAIPERHPMIMEETKETYGVVIYQEQVLNIMKKIGLTVEEIEKVRKAIKSSNDNVAKARAILADLQVKIEQQSKHHGMSALDVAWLNDAVSAYADYGFNKAHSTSYAVIAYYTAYMRCHHPVEFWAGMLDAYGDSATKTWYGVGPQRAHIKQADAYQKAAAKDGVNILGVHVNKSRKTWTIDTRLKGIRKGLETVPGMGPAACNEIENHQPFTSLDDLAMRVSSQRVSGAKSLGEGHTPLACGGSIAELFKVGALDELERDPVLEAERATARLAKEAKEQEQQRKKDLAALKVTVQDALAKKFDNRNIQVKKNKRYHELVALLVELMDKKSYETLTPEMHKYVDEWLETP